MLVARLGTAVSARSSHKLLFAAGLAVLCLTFAFAGAPTQAQAQVCGGPRVSLALTAPVATTSRRDVSVIGWLGARAGTALAEKGFLTGIEWVGSLAGHDSAGDRALRQLGEIRGHLNQVSSQLGRIQSQLDHIAAAGNSRAFDAAMEPLCVIARQQRTLFVEFYEPLIRTGYQLAEVLDSDHPERADDTTRGPSLQQRVAALLSDFMRRSELRDNAGDFETLRHALVPDFQKEKTSILSRYGLVLMSKRFLTRADSELIRHLYRELAEIRAIATWMSEEYWSGRPARRDLVVRRQQAMVRDNAAEESGLPPMIPPGVVIDLGSGPRGSLMRKPIWYAPADRDLGWLPSPLSGYDPATRSGFQISNNEVGQQLQDLNFPPSVLSRVPGLGDKWRAPTRVQLEALISNGCEADPADPNRFVDAVKCSNAVTAADGGTVAGYLSRLNEGNDRWRRLFCTRRSGGSPCPEGAGPDAAKFRHVFIWTSNQHGERMDCGSENVKGIDGGGTRLFRRMLPTYTGFRTTTSGHDWQAFPQLVGGPARPAWQTNAEQSYNVCDAWLAQRFAEAPQGNILLKGILLATRRVEVSDLNKRNGIDYMGQWRAAD